MEANIYAENYIYRQTAERFSDVMWSMGQLLFSSFDKRLAAYLTDEYVKLGSDVISTTHEQIAKNLALPGRWCPACSNILKKRAWLPLAAEPLP